MFAVVIRSTRLDSLAELAPQPDAINKLHTAQRMDKRGLHGYARNRQIWFSLDVHSAPHETLGCLDYSTSSFIIPALFFVYGFGREVSPPIQHIRRCRG